MLKPFNMNDRIQKISEIRCEEVFEVIRVGGPVSVNWCSCNYSTKSKSINEQMNQSSFQFKCADR